MNGIEVTRRLRAAHPDVEVVMLTMLEDDDSLFAAMDEAANHRPCHRPRTDARGQDQASGRPGP